MRREGKTASTLQICGSNAFDIVFLGSCVSLVLTLVSVWWEALAVVADRFVVDAVSMVCFLNGFLMERREHFRSPFMIKK